MPIKWSDDLLTGNELIDSQHKTLIEMINDFYSAAGKGKSGEKTLQLLDFLKDYILKHFAAEETLTRNSNYPEKDDHIESHNYYRKNFHILTKKN